MLEGRHLMSDQCNNMQSAEKPGFAFWIGMLLLVGAVGAVVYYFIAKPMLEKEDLGIQQELEVIKEQTGDTVSAVKDQLVHVKDEVTYKYNKATAKEIKSPFKDVPKKRKKRKKRRKDSEDMPVFVEAVQSLGNDILDKSTSKDKGWY